MITAHEYTRTNLPSSRKQQVLGVSEESGCSQGRLVIKNIGVRHRERGGCVVCMMRNEAKLTGGYVEVCMEHLKQTAT